MGVGVAVEVDVPECGFDVCDPDQTTVKAEKSIDQSNSPHHIDTQSDNKDSLTDWLIALFRGRRQAWENLVQACWKTLRRGG